MCFWDALSTDIDAGQVALFAGVGTLLGVGMGGIGYIGFKAAAAYFGVGTSIWNFLNVDGDPTNEVLGISNSLNRFTGMIYRNATGSPSSLTPRPGIDDISGGGLSFFNNLDKLNPGKYVAIDASKLSKLTAVFDNNPPGHVTVTPSTISELQAWAATRGTEVVHQFTQELISLATIGKK